MEFIKKYFEDDVDYPENIALDPIPWGGFWGYISTTFLNGFINYIENQYDKKNTGIKAGYVIARYHNWDEKLDHEVTIAEPAGTTKWTKFSGTKLEIFEKLTEEGRVWHPKLDSDFQDDVLILGKLAERKWIVFWFDRDCSDSCIGRFETECEDDEVISDFKRWASESDFGISEERAKEIPIHYFSRGWLRS